MTRLNLTGQKFGKWTVIKFTEMKEKRGSYWLCRCECGNEKELRAIQFLRGKSKSCGCYKIERLRRVAFKHGALGTPEYKAWQSMIQRCTNPNVKQFFDYGMRGITVCERWLHSFENFISDMGNRTSLKHTLDRIENDKGYYKENCRWATMKQQSRNKRSNVWLEYNGKRMIQSDWARELNTSTTNIRYWLKRESFEMIVKRLNQLT